MKAGIGYVNQSDPVKAGMDAASQALEQGGIQQGGLAFAFCAGTVEHEGYWRGLRTVLGPDIPIVGGSAIGIITGDTLSYAGYPAGVAVLECDPAMFPVETVRGLDTDEHAAGKALGKKICDHDDCRVLTVFYDSIRTPATADMPPVMNSSTPLLDGIAESLGHMPVVGAGLIGDYAFQPVNQFCGDHIAAQSVTGIVMPDGIDVYCRIMHGCTPLDGSYHTITRMDGRVISEIDGQPAVRMIDAIYGHNDWRTQLPVQLLTIGVNHGDRYGVMRESEYVNRLITGALPDGSGIGLFECDLEEGMDFQFMLRSSAAMIESTRRNSLELMQEVERAGKRPFFAMYIDCAGRAAEQSHTLTEEASMVQEVMRGSGVPLFGFYSGVEIAPLLGRSRGLDWTGVLMLLATD